ncbi:hypothetical protein F5B21DRAFT_302189 [Xylaria acuta]|nr:hypothetical protein F5B21DRAFT_302189 [Xylaria acuta]
MVLYSVLYCCMRCHVSLRVRLLFWPPLITPQLRRSGCLHVLCVYIMTSDNASRDIGLQSGCAPLGTDWTAMGPVRRCIPLEAILSIHVEFTLLCARSLFRPRPRLEWADQAINCCLIYDIVLDENKVLTSSRGGNTHVISMVIYTCSVCSYIPSHWYPSRWFSNRDTAPC